MTSLRILNQGRFLFGSFLIITVLAISQNILASTIAGFVYDKSGNVITDVDVELQNENYVTRQRTKTDTVGRYSFADVADGRYYVKVMPFRYNLEDQVQDVEIATQSVFGAGQGNIYFEKDFYLAPRKGVLAETANGVLFVQDVPKDAENLFKAAQDDLTNGRTPAGLENLMKAINAFPTYHAALKLLGMQLLQTKQYIDAAKLFIRAVEVNPKSSHSFYWMAFALNQIGPEYNPAALKALEKAAVLAPASYEVAFLAGKIFRQQGDFAEAEKQLIRAKRFTNSDIPEIHIELAQLYANDMKKFDKAADELEAYLKASNKTDAAIDAQIANLREKAKAGG